MIAVLQVADTGPLESLVIMLRAAGVQCMLPTSDLKDAMRRARCDTVYDIDHLVHNMGYDRPMSLPTCSLAEFEKLQGKCLLVDVKGHRNYEHIVRRWPYMAGRVLWYRINGAQPEIVPGCGDEVNPPCPVLTPNQCYKDSLVCPCCHACYNKDVPRWAGEIGRCDCRFDLEWTGWANRTYVCWPPFYRFDEYFARNGRAVEQYVRPVCLIHRVQNWGYHAVIDNMRAMDVAIYGVGSPDGLRKHTEIPWMLSRALCMVHLKSNDAPGYAIYEALAAACPVVCTRRLIWRCRMQDLLVPGETCLTFDRETHDGLSDADIAECTREVKEHIERLKDPTENKRIGHAGMERLRDIMWSEGREQDVRTLVEFLEEHYAASRQPTHL